MIFKKKNKNIIKVVHYDGLRGFNQDYPCTIEEKDDSFEIKKIKPEMVVTLPKNKIVSIDSLNDNEFMQKYHNTIGTNDKKYYLIITYNSDENAENQIIFWGTSFEAIKFNKLKYKYNGNIGNYTL